MESKYRDDTEKLVQNVLGQVESGASLPLAQLGILNDIARTSALIADQNVEIIAILNAIERGE